MSAQVLVVDDERLIRTSVQRALAAGGHQAQAAGSRAEANAALDGARFDLAIVDLRLGDGSGFDLLARLRDESPETKVIVITAHGSVQSAVEAMKQGAFDFVEKPFELERLLATAEHALRAGALERQVAYHARRERSKVDEATVVVPSRSAAMRRLDREIEAVAPQLIPVVLVVGDTGAGKALVARRLHFGSADGRARGPFVELNAAAIPELLVESELFGHERGAFSDARERKLGLVEVADGGTLFLDEVGDLGAAAQAKLLTFLESLTFRRVGATASRTVDVRIVAATNRDLARLVEEGRFRADLYYRLSSIVLCVPPLRERVEDIAPLAEHFLAADAARFHKRLRALSKAAAAVLAAWRWPGNVRELKAVIQRAVLMHDGPELLVEHLPPELVAHAVDPTARALAKGVAALPTLEEIELRYMRTILALHGGNKLRAAERLGISRQTLAKRLGEGDEPGP